MKLLIDSDFLYGSIDQRDSHYNTSVNLFKKCKFQGDEFFVLSSVLQEVGTILSHRFDVEHVRIFYKEIKNMGFHVIHLTEALETSAWEIFLKQTKKGCSFVDCANIAAIEWAKFDGILSFDVFYPKSLRRL